MELDVFHKFYYLSRTLLTDEQTDHAIQNQNKCVVQGWSLRHRDWDPAEMGEDITLWMASSFWEYEQVHFGESTDNTDIAYLRRFYKSEMKMVYFHLTHVVLCPLT